MLMTKVLDYFDPASDFDNDLHETLKHVSAHFLVVSFTGDWRFSPMRSREIVKPLVDNNKQVSYAEIEASIGHDAFLLPITTYMKTFDAYMKHVAGGVRD